MERFMTQTKVLRTVLALLMLVDLATLRALAEDVRAKVTKTEFTGDTVYLFYDLAGPPQEVYSVSLIMKKKSDPNYSYAPKYAAGDLGQSMFSGTGWRIAWNFSREFPGGLDKNDVYFIVEAKGSGGGTASGGGTNTLLWMAGGAVVVGGIVALVLLNRSGDNGNGGGGSGSAFPPPPGRP